MSNAMIRSTKRSQPGTLHHALRGLCLAALLVGLVAGSGIAQEVNDLLYYAVTARREGRYDEGAKLLDLAIKKEPTNPTLYYVRATILELQRKFASALADLDETVLLTPETWEGYQSRGMVQFKLGNVKKSVADFDKVIEMEPETAARHWQRGISCYYAGQFEEGRKQFELHQTVNSSDVENGVWHFLCVAKTEGFDTARAAMIDISGDARVPMAQVYELFRGKVKPEAVFAAAESGSGDEAKKSNQLFNAHLYVGLYYEAQSDAANARKHITIAARDYPQKHYMWEVARVHAERLAGR